MIEFIQSLPTLPLWMALATLVPPNWSPIQVYFSISVVLAIIGWTGLARVVRGKLISLREEDYILAAKLCGARERDIIIKHLLPGFSSYLIVHLTLAIPSMILGETSLSFLGLGIRAPAVSLGTQQTAPRLGMSQFPTIRGWRSLGRHRGRCSQVTTAGC